jgi:hypothetical protein
MTVLPQAEAKGSTWNMLHFLGLCLSQHCKFLMLAFFVKKQYFEKELMKIKNTAINAES